MRKRATTTPQARDRATLEEVAALAGVSRSTASRVFNNSPSVSPDVRARVERAASRLGYVPNRAARSLVNGRADSVGLVIPEPTTRLFGDPFFPWLLRGISKGLAQSELQLMLFMAQAGGEENRLERYLAAGHVDGVLLVSLHGDDPLPLALARHGLPVVLGGRPLRDSGELCYVDVDNRQGAAQATRHLIEQDRRLVVTLAGPQDMGVGVDRLAGWRDALAAAGLPCGDEQVEVGDFTYESGLVGMRALLDRLPELDGVVAASEPMALGALAALRERGRRVPADVAVVGYDDTGMALAADPPLTSVRQPIELMGQEMARLLLHLIRTGERIPRHVVLGTELVVRASSATPPGSA